jgi:hypothetical protein
MHLIIYKRLQILALYIDLSELMVLVFLVDKLKVSELSDNANGISELLKVKDMLAFIIYRQWCIALYSR